MRAKTIVLLLALATLHLLVIFAGFIAPYDSAAQNREAPYSSPTRVHFVDAAGFHLRPFVYVSTFVLDSYQEDRTCEFPIRLFVRGDTYTILGMFKSTLHLFRVDEPGHIFLLGTDGYGRDEFSRLLYGGQISLAAGVLATLLSLAAGAVIGTVSGYYGKWVDESLMGTAELFLSLPWFYFLIAVRAFLPLHLSPARTFLLLICVIGLIGWARPARLVRGVVLSARARNFVSAARGFGATDLYLLRRHIFPETFGVLLTHTALLGWGSMLSTLQQYNVLVSYGWLLAPAAALVVTSVIYWLLADALHSRLKSHSI